MPSLFDILTGRGALSKTPQEEPTGLMGLLSAVTSNPMMARQFKAQAEANPRPNLAEVIGYPKTWAEFGQNLGNQLPINSPEAVRGAAFNLAMNFGPQATVYHGTRNVKTWMDNPVAVKMMDEGKDIPRGIAESTYPIGTLKGSPGGLKMMDGMGPHVGTAEAANERLAKNVGLRPSTAFNKPNARLSDAYIMPMEFNPSKPFVKKDGTPYTEGELQKRLSDMAESLGFSRMDTRHYSSVYATPAKMKQAQKAVRDKLIADGYDAIPYINSHEARGSVSYVVLKPEQLETIFK